jgi:hypothetical protein
LREVINRVARIPDLIDTAIAVPNLSLNEIKCKINTLRGLIPGEKQQVLTGVPSP